MCLSIIKVPSSFPTRSGSLKYSYLPGTARSKTAFHDNNVLYPVIRHNTAKARNTISRTSAFQNTILERAITPECRPYYKKHPELIGYILNKITKGFLAADTLLLCNAKQLQMLLLFPPLLPPPSSPSLFFFPLLFFRALSVLRG